MNRNQMNTQQQKIQTTRPTHWLTTTTLLASIFAASLSRLIPHAPNFTAIGALALFGGMYLQDRRLSLVAPLIAMLLTDLALGLHSTMIFVYASVAFISVLGWFTKPKLSSAGPMSVLASIAFFVVTNLGVWMSSGMYPQTLQGLQNCFVAALPFFENTLTSQLLFTGILVGGFEIAKKRWAVLAA